MIEIEVQINNFKDKENYSKPTHVIRNGIEVVLQNKLYQSGDKYRMSEERYEYLSKKGIVKKIAKEKPSKESKED